MAGGRSQRFARDEDSSSVAIDGAKLEAELLQRLEDRAAALAETTSRLAVVESALEAERKGRQQLTEDLKAARAKVQQLGGSALRSHTAAVQVSELEDELRRERENSENLALRLDEAWAETQRLNESLQSSRGVLRRRRS